MLQLLTEVTPGLSPQDGRQDLLLAGGKIEDMAPAGRFPSGGLPAERVDCSGLFAFPALIDQHVHVMGAGGEQGFASRTREIPAPEIFAAGVGTVVGLLGTDACTRSPEALFAKAAALETQGVTAYLYAGSYAVPPVTFTGSVERDMLLLDRVLGVGEIAISDHRSSQPTAQQLLEIAAQVHRGALLAGKAGVLHLHVGNSPEGLRPLRALQKSDLPLRMFVPTHVNRSRRLFEEAVAYCRGGGNIDLTAGETKGVPVAEAVGRLIARGAPMERVTLSSDAGGSVPGGSVSRIGALAEDIRRCVERGVPPPLAFRLAGEHTARLLGIYPRKGALLPGSDADILLTDEHYRLQKLFCGGVLRCDAGMPLPAGIPLPAGS